MFSLNRGVLMIELPDTSTEKGQRRASVLLARFCGWFPEKQLDVTDLGGWVAVRFYDYGDFVNLYHPQNMCIAWKVLNYAHGKTVGYFNDMPLVIGRLADETMIPYEAQRAWLDKILELANEAGMLDGVQQ